VADPAAEPSARRCASCGAAVAEAFCARCGERLLAAEELTLRAQLAQLVGGLFSLDGRLWRSFALLVVRPGHLAAEYCRGARVRWMRPVQLFLVANLAYFLLQPFTGANTLNTTLELQTRQQNYSAHLLRRVEAHLAASGEDARLYAERFDRTTSALARSLVLVLVPAFAALLALLARGTARGSVEHLVLATHGVAFQLAVVHLPITWLIGRARLDEGASSLLLVLCDSVWWLLALRRFYAFGWTRAVLGALALGAATLPIVLTYRYLLFWAAFGLT
jgi:hypothetical protein